MNILTVLDNCPWNEYTFASVKGYLPSLTIMSVLWLLYRLFFFWLFTNGCRFFKMVALLGCEPVTSEMHFLRKIN